MQIIKFKKKNNSYDVYLKDGSIINLNSELILKNNLLLSKEIDDINKIKEDNKIYEAYDKSLKYINKRMRSTLEMDTYLKDYPSKVKEDIINRLTKEGYINDLNYIKYYISDQINLTNKGYYKIKQELIKRGLKEEDIINALDNIDKDIWLDKITKQVNKDLKIKSNLSIGMQKNKIINHLINLGYQKELLIPYVEHLDINDSDNLIKAYNKVLNSLERKYQDDELKSKVITKLMRMGYTYPQIKEVMDK